METEKESIDKAIAILKRVIKFIKTKDFYAAKVKNNIFAKINAMKKIIITLFILIICKFCLAQHMYDHTFPHITSQNQEVNNMLEQVTDNHIVNYINHLTLYTNRRADATHIYDVKDWLVSEYENMNIDSIYLHEFSMIPHHDSVPLITAPNVLAYQIGKTKPDEFIICGAHYDSFVKAEGEYNPDTIVSPGADDNASGVAGILTTARILSNYDFERTIIYACWNAEEFGLLGSAAFAKDCHDDSLDVVAYFNLDMTGYLNPGDDIHITLLYNNCDSLLGNFMQEVSHTYLPDIVIYHDWLLWGDTDYSSFNRNEYQSISQSEDVYYLSPYIHSANDIVGLSVNNLEQSVVFTKLNLASVALAAGIYHESENEVDFSDKTVESFEIYDIFGHLVYKEKSVWKNMEEIRVTNLPSDIYIIRFFSESGKSFSKKYFIKY